jgi:hypothetical protein
MAVVDYRVNNRRVGVRTFMVPKRASELKYWYKAAQKALPAMPDWFDGLAQCADVTVETIIITWPDNGLEHMVTIARKRQLM